MVKSSLIAMKRDSFQQIHAIEHAMTRSMTSHSREQIIIDTRMFQGPYESGTPSHRMSQQHLTWINSRGACPKLYKNSIQTPHAPVNRCTALELKHGNCISTKRNSTSKLNKPIWQIDMRIDTLTKAFNFEVDQLCTKKKRFVNNVQTDTAGQRLTTLHETLI